jgi:hypothetical protein
MADPIIALPISAFQPRGEASLFKVMVRGQGLSQAPLAHHHEGNAVRQGPLLVGATTVQGQPSKEPVIGGGDDLQVGARQQGIKPPGEQLPI